MKFFYWLIKLLLGWSVWLFFRPKIRYENKQATKTKGGAVIISNHTSVLDGMLLGLTFPLATIWSLTGEICFDKNRLGTLFLKMLLSIRVDRMGHNLSFMAEATDKLRRGDSVLIFPQSRLPDEGETDTPPFLPTFVLLAKAAGCPIIPVWHAEQYSLRRAKVAVGAPISLDGVDCTAYEDVKALTADIQARLYALASLHADKAKPAE